jgi:SAM-dependent methyltransferase
MTQTATTQATDEPEIQRVFQSKAETKAFYDKISHVYDLLAEHSEGPVRRAGLEKLDAQPGEKVLEIGFGTGHSLVSLAQSVGPTGKVYGLDLSERMLDVARDNLHKAGLADRVELTCGDAVQLPYPSDLVDAIFMSFTLELFDTPEMRSPRSWPSASASCGRRGGSLSSGFPRKARAASSYRPSSGATGISPTWWTAARSSSASPWRSLASASRARKGR